MTSLKNSEGEIPMAEDQALVSLSDLKRLFQNESSSFEKRIAVLEREMALLKLDMAELKIAHPQAPAMKPSVLQLLELQSQESNVELELSDKKEEDAELSDKKEEEAELSDKKWAFIPRVLEVRRLSQNLEPSAVQTHEAKKNALKLKADNKRAMLEGDGSTWLVEEVEI